MTAEHQDAVQHEVNRLLDALSDMAIAEHNGADDGTLTGFVVGATAARDHLLMTGPAASAFDALTRLALAVHAHYKETAP